VRPDQRRQGILTELMRRQHEDARQRGEPVAILWASEGSIYQRFGYGLAAMDGAIEIDTRRTGFLRPMAPEGRVRLLTEPEAAAALPPVYESMRRMTPGAISCSEAWWQIGPISENESRRRDSGPKYLALFEADGSAEGYAIYRVKPRWEQRGPNGTLEISEAVTTTPRALRELWRYLFDTDLVRTVKAARVPVPFPLQLVLTEPRALGLVVHDGLWLRLLDLPAALGSRTYGTSDTIVLDVTDELCPWNAGRWRLDVDGPGTAVRIERSDAAADVVLDTTDLAAMYLGGVQARQLALAGRIVEATPGALARADALFASDHAPWCVSMF
jgi:predicted acetyltransferase